MGAADEFFAFGGAGGLYYLDKNDTKTPSMRRPHQDIPFEHFLVALLLLLLGGLLVGRYRVLGLVCMVPYALIGLKVLFSYFGRKGGSK